MFLKGLQIGKHRDITFLYTFLTLMPAVISPWACRLRSSVTVAIGLSPAFSANVHGITSRASAKVLQI
jgi:hypothetical protein